MFVNANVSNNATPTMPQSTTFLFQQAIHFDSAYAPLPTKEEERKTLQQQLREEERDEQDAAKPHEKSSTTTVLHTGFLEFMKTVCGEHNPKQTKQDCTPTSVDTESEPIDPVKVLEGIMNGQSTEDMEVSDALAGNEQDKLAKLAKPKPPKGTCTLPYAIVRFQGTKSATRAFSHYNPTNPTNLPPRAPRAPLAPLTPVAAATSLLLMDLHEQSRGALLTSSLPTCTIDVKHVLLPSCQTSIHVAMPTPEEIKRAMCKDETVEPTGNAACC